MRPSTLFIPLASLAASLASACDPSTLNTTLYLYPITETGTTVFDVARLTGRGVCDIGRANLMADVTIIPNVGQTLWIPPQVCEPDNTSCLIPDTNRTRTCIYGGPRLYYTVNGDTYDVIARRLNISTAVLLADDNGANYTATSALPVGTFIKVPTCSPSRCVIEPFDFTEGVYLDLARKYGTTVGQIMMLSPTYNYSVSLYEDTGASTPTINMAYNCTALSSNVTALT
ncbi:hypothetical protein ASPZODRAFT_114656 [Penicilliopsis zonata CBS 506.65]|uniref:LysM domain-containing protein n=1 Tax=Penicilliopsis zonata CBS 506.65 TaxID=1073090 RepID=A0A1L9SKJ3_9EURO|nr:hypothetical protein ASPZODRAFT_114656 [Penicilliopsis zonata CBS 506.65]OJJ47685.1 hypothetical protein ASPZODRAFT_114656 [Penicilliopsis zonata CBS 506.65]